MAEPASTPKTEKIWGPPSEEVNRFHDNDDVDTSSLSHHHTLGYLPTQAAKGSHTHDGADSAALFKGMKDQYNNDQSPSWKNGISVPSFMMSEVVDDNTYTGWGASGVTKIAIASDTCYAVAGHTYLVMTSFDHRGTVASFVSATMKHNTLDLPPAPVGSPAYAIPSLPQPSTSSPSFGLARIYDLGTGFRTYEYSQTYTPTYNGAFRLGLFLSVNSGTMDLRRPVIRVIDVGRPNPTGTGGMRELAILVANELRRMGAEISILGAPSHDYHT